MCLHPACAWRRMCHASQRRRGGAAENQAAFHESIASKAKVPAKTKRFRVDLDALCHHSHLRDKRQRTLCMENAHQNNWIRFPHAKVHRPVQDTWHRGSPLRSCTRITINTGRPLDNTLHKNSPSAPTKCNMVLPCTTAKINYARSGPLIKKIVLTHLPRGVAKLLVGMKNWQMGISCSFGKKVVIQEKNKANSQSRAKGDPLVCLNG